MSLSVGPYSPTQSIYENARLQNNILDVATKFGTITGTKGFGSSLFLNRIGLSGAMNLSEVDILLGLSFNATSDGQGSMSRSFCIYSFGNSSSLQSVLSFSSSSSWTTGTVTVGGSTSLSQFQGGWALPGIQIIVPMTFPSSYLPAGEYVVGQLIDFNQASSSWTASLMGPQNIMSVTGSVITNSSTAAAMSSQGLGLLGVSAFSASSSSAITAFSALPTAANVLSSGGLLVGSNFTATTEVSVLSSTGLAAASGINGALGVARYGSQFLALSTAGSMTSFQLSATVTTTKSSQTVSGSAFVVTLTNTAVQSCSWGIGGVSSNNSIVSNVTLGTLAGSILTASGSAAVLSNGGLLAGSFLTSSSSAPVISNAGTAGYSLLASGGLIAGSILTSTGSIGAITSLGNITATFARLSLTQNFFSYIGTGSGKSQNPSIFQAGIMSTGAIPAQITLTSTAVTFSGNPTIQQPWFRLIGA